MNEDLALASRSGLPDALRVLVEALPRGIWETHPNFSPLTRFWLDRHLMFREILGRLGDDSRAFLDGRLPGPQYGRDTARLAGMLLEQLEGHHTIEDLHYFPILQGLDGRLQRGFDLLDADHDALHARMAALATATNAMLTGLGGDDPKAGAGSLKVTLDEFRHLLDRHLTDEEDLIVPVILAHAPRIG